MRKKSIFTLLLIIFVMTGCKKEMNETVNFNKEDSSSSVAINSSDLNKTSSSTSKENQTEMISDNVEEIPSSDFSDEIKKLSKAVILVGNSKNSSYQEISKELNEACEEMDVEFYQTDLTDEPGKKIKDQYKFGDIYDILVVIDGKIQRIEIGGGDSLNADILQKVFTMYGL